MNTKKKTNVNKFHTQAPLLEGAFTLSKHPGTEGFDMEAGKTWIFPTNYSFREYQFNIIQQALFQNTMVSLPTGLGKTFIAAVIMYNFYRWYPMGKIIFMAPTRPLVKQQIDACYNIMAIPADSTAELTGTKAQSSRKEVWNQKRVFFVTPQVLQNDLNILTELGTNIKCLVFDEAHKAKGNHAYCEVIRKLVPLNVSFRVVALSATPGSTLDDVLEVIHNLLISHLEIRTDESPDVTPYIFERSLETVVVPLGGKLQQVRDAYIQILEKYTRILIQHKVLSGNCSTLTKGKIFMTLKEYKTNNQNGRSTSYPEIVRNLNICITLYHAYELLVRHGLRGFLSFFEDHADKPLLRGNPEILGMMEDVRNYLGPVPHIEPLPDGSIADIPMNSKFGHPKFYKLLDILSEHFNNPNNNSSRVIVFCEYRESVMEAYALLLRHRPLILPRIFLGQGAISQRQQIAVVKAFREGKCNTLISTCIGEEGLDVGSVDLIVCFDINNRSPVRMVQRMGRTGRKREGRVVILVTEGKEQQTLKECLIHKQNLTNHILQSSALYKNMYKGNPRMVPENTEPECQKIFMTIQHNNKPQKSRNSKIKDMFENISSKNIKEMVEDEMCQLNINKNRIPSRQQFWTKGNQLEVEFNEDQINFSKKINKLRVFQQTSEIGPSKSTELLVSLLQFAESKKYQLPITQVSVIPSQILQPPKPIVSTGLKQADIRNMFAKKSTTYSIDLTQEKDSEDVEEINCDKQILNDLCIEIGNYLTLDTENTSCKVCENLFNCSQIKSTLELDIKSICDPDKGVLESCNINNFELFRKFLKSESEKTDSPSKENNNNFIKSVTPICNIYERTFLNPLGTTGLKDTPLRKPSSVNNILKKCGITPNLNDSLFDNVSFTQFEKTVKTVNEKASLQSFVDAEFTQMKKQTNVEVEDLKFFNNESLDDIFSDECIQDLSQSTIIYSKTENFNNDTANVLLEPKQSMSPIISSNNILKNNVNKKLFTSFCEIPKDVDGLVSNCERYNTLTQNYQELKNVNQLSTSNKQKLNNEQYKSLCDKQETLEQLNKSDIMDDIASFADLSAFGFDESFENQIPINEPKNNEAIDFPEDPWFDFLADFTKDQTTAEDSDVSMLRRTEVTDNVLNIKTPTKQKSDVIYSVDTSPILSNRFTQISKSGTKDVLNPKTPTKFNVDIRLADLSSISPVLNNRVSTNIIKTETSANSKENLITMSDLSDTSPVLSYRPIKHGKDIDSYTTDSKTLTTHNENLLNLPGLVDTSPLLTNPLTQITKETKTQCTNFKLSITKFQSTACSSQPSLEINDSENSLESKLSLQRNYLNKSSDFMFRHKNSPSKKICKLLSSSSSDSPIQNIKSKRDKWLNKPPPKSCTLSTIVVSSDSDDDFEMPVTTAKWLCQIPRKKIKENNNGNKKNFACRKSMELRRRKRPKKKWDNCEYFEVEAELELDENATSDTDEEDTDDDQFEKSFVDDNTQNIANTTITHAQYLKSIRSPINRGKFKIPQKLPSNLNVYSQIVDEGENTYVNDSFCVDTEEDSELFSKEQTISELEIAELVLEEEHRNSKRNRNKSKDLPKSKRRRIMQIHSDSD